MQYIVSLFVAAALLFSTADFAAKPVQATSPFSADQQAAIEKTVHDYLINHPEVLVEASQMLQKREQEAVIKKASDIIPTIANDLFLDANSPTVGNPKGKVTIVEFFDYQCPHCKHMVPIFQKILQANPDVRVVYKEFPIFGEPSIYAARAALAAAKQGKFQQLHDAFLNYSKPFASKEDVLKIAESAGLDTKKLEVDMQDKSIEAEIRSTYKLAQKMGVGGTPAIVVAKTPSTAVAPTKESLSPAFIPGATDVTSLQKLIDALKK